MNKQSRVLACLFFCFQAVSVQSQDMAEWIRLFNSSADALTELYDPKAVFVTLELEAKSGIAAPAFYGPLKKSIGSVGSANSIAKIAASPKADYEIVELQAAGGQLLKQLVIWKKKDSQVLRELEATLIAEENLSPDPGIDAARNKWMELCNKHLPAELVSQVYTPQAIYYNHRPVVTGTAAISREYGYMASSQYNLKLTPLYVEMVRENVAFELGQCSGSYGGKYVLIWVRNEDGTWQVAFDSNI